MKSNAGAVYSPPRPNLGPESPGTRPSYGWILSIAISLLVVLILSGSVRRRARRARRAHPAEAQPNTTLPAPSTPREQVIAAAAMVRQTLAEQFGPPWKARTTEEIVSDPALESRLPDAERTRLALLLSLADLAKFGAAADSDFNPDAYGEDWDALRIRLLSLLASDAGASSTTSG